MLFALATLCLPALAQPRFEAASVRENRRFRCQGRWDFSAARGMVVAENAPLRRIISRAYGLTDDRVEGPAWLDSQCYDIRAKAPKGASDDELMAMLRGLLAERFHLVAGHETAERAAFALEVDKGGSKLRPYGERVDTPTSANLGRVLFLARHLPDLCERLGKVTGRPVIDRTGLQGDYQIELAYFPYTPTEADPVDAVEDIFSAVRTQLGLRLEPARATVEILRIRSLDKTPAAN
jgi:uncharacterized protein (TIGR03435 family)